MKIHGKIQEKLEKQYKKLGYKVKLEATIRYNNIGNFYRVDLLAIKGNKRIVVEIGRTSNEKKKTLELLGYEFKNVPFHKISDYGLFICICGHNWMPRLKKPKACPKCKQYLTYLE